MERFNTIVQALGHDVGIHGMGAYGVLLLGLVALASAVVLIASLPKSPTHAPLILRPRSIWLAVAALLLLSGLFAWRLGLHSLEAMPPVLTALPDHVKAWPRVNGVVDAVQPIAYRRCPQTLKRQRVPLTRTARTVTPPDCDHCPYYPKITYHYTVAPFSGQRLSRAGRPLVRTTLPTGSALSPDRDDDAWRSPCFRVQSDYETFAARYPVGSSVTVYIKPGSLGERALIDLRR